MAAAVTKFLSHNGIYLILVLGFVLRVAMVTASIHLPIKWDENAYVNHAQVILDDITAYSDLFRPPLYSAFLAFVAWVSSEGRFAMGMIQALLSTVSIALIYSLARERFQRKDVARIAALFFALYIEFITLTRLYLTETLFITLLLTAFYLLLRLLRSPRAVTALAAGILFALAALTREIVIHFVAMIIPIWFLLAFRWRRAIVLIVGFSVGVVLILTPWVARNYSIEHRFILIGNSGEFTLLRDNIRAERDMFPDRRNPLSSKRQSKQELKKVPPADQSRYAWTRVIGIVSSAPLRWLGLRAEVLPQVWQPLSLGNRTIRLKLGTTAFDVLATQLLDYSAVALILLAVVGLFSSRDDPAKLIILLFVLYTLAVVFLTHYQPRFRVPLFALLLPDAALGLVNLVDALRHPQKLQSALKHARWYVGTAVIVLFVALALGGQG
jgi:4-amino-4-deoxy-L-arabinose transferase-like glycosyltransferase